MVPRRFCRADEDEVPFDPDGVWLPLAFDAVSPALRFLLFDVPFAVPLVPLPVVVVEEDDDGAPADDWF